MFGFKQTRTDRMIDVANFHNGTQEHNQKPQNYETISIIIFTTEITLVILGLLGNSLCFAVTVKTNLRKMSSTVYLSVLAVCDNVILLWTNVVGSLMSYDLWLGRDVRHLHPVFCWGLEYVQYWLSQLSSWCLVAFTIERAVAVLYPHKYELFLILSPENVINSHAVMFFSEELMSKNQNRQFVNSFPKQSRLPVKIPTHWHNLYFTFFHLK